MKKLLVILFLFFIFSYFANSVLAGKCTGVRCDRGYECTNYNGMARCVKSTGGGCNANSWGGWSACSVTCGGGRQSRTNECGNIQAQVCNTQACIVMLPTATPTPRVCGGIAGAICPQGEACSNFGGEGADLQGICVPGSTAGDADGDGKVNFKDYFYYVSAKYGGGVPATVKVDFNKDGLINNNDRQVLIKPLLFILSGLAVL